MEQQPTLFDEIEIEEKREKEAKQQIKNEAIAEMFETMATGGTRREAMLKYFPTAFNYFESYIKGLLK